MSLRANVCFAISRRLLNPAGEAINTSYTAYDNWRHDSLRDSWSRFSDEIVAGKDVLDFGCGDGQMSMYLSAHKHPRSVTGIDITTWGIERARKNAPHLRFVLGNADQMPLPDQSFDTIVAFDCMEHVMKPAEILNDWFRVLRPGGTCAIEWFPYRGPWGPHLDNLVPIPWAHVLFGERAMLRTAANIYDLPGFPVCHWDRDDQGNKLPNKWRKLQSFAQGNFINKLTVGEFRRLVRQAGFTISRMEARSFSGTRTRKVIGGVLKRLPVFGEYFVSHYLIELRRPG